MKNRVFTKQSDAGFSILEGLVVVVIIGILTSIAAPGWLTFMNRQRATNVKNEVQQAIRTTQTEAKRLRRRRSLQFIPSTSTSSGIPEIGINNGYTQQVGQGEIKGGMLEMIATDSNGNAVPELVFRANGSVSVEDDDYAGTAPSLPVTIRFFPLAGGNMQRCISVRNLLGSIDSARDADCNT